MVIYCWTLQGNVSISPENMTICSEKLSTSLLVYVLSVFMTAIC
jgi:hypothetical protein